jgi:hypothetical protein
VSDSRAEERARGWSPKHWVGDRITLRNQPGELHGRVKIDRIKPGCLQAHWPEANVIIPAGRLDPSGVPDYNTTVEVVGAACLAGAAVAAD